MTPYLNDYRGRKPTPDRRGRWETDSEVLARVVKIRIGPCECGCGGTADEVTVSLPPRLYLLVPGLGEA